MSVIGVCSVLEAVASFVGSPEPEINEKNDVNQGKVSDVMSAYEVIVNTADEATNYQQIYVIVFQKYPLEYKHQHK